MNNLTHRDIHYTLSRLPKDVLAMLKDRKGLILAGGFIRACISGETPNDIDLFGPDLRYLQEAAEKLTLGRADKNQQVRKFQTSNAITLLTPPRTPIQLINRWVYQTLDDCVRSFDFTIVQAAIQWDGEYWIGRCSESFYSDLAAKRLEYTCPERNEDAGGSILRVVKYLRRGYNLRPESLAAVMGQMMGAIKNERPIHEVTPEWRKTLITALLREVDPLTVVDGFELVDSTEEI